MRTPRTSFGGAALAAGLATWAACGTARLGETAQPALPELDAQAARGEVVFMQRCHKCHPDGEAGLGPAINGKPLPGFLVHLQIRQGLGSMPSFDDELIDEGQLDDLLAYIATR